MPREPVRAELEAAFDGSRDRYVAEWSEWLRFPSVSTDPARHDDCLRCARWLRAHLAAIGFEACLLETSRHPVVFAERKGRSGAPVVLFYGHYDVQPPDPLEAWRSPPFEPVLRDGRLYARGAEDNKGQCFCVLKAVEALCRADLLDVTVKIIVEGEEESGSRGVSEALTGWRDLLRADVLLVTDTAAAPDRRPALTLGLRGIVHATLEVVGPLRDLHSGVHGGLAPNPAAAAAVLVASLHAPDGSVAVDGFYDGVLPPAEEERAACLEAGFDAERYTRETGVPPAGGENAVPPAERTGFRPSLDLNGFHAGYGGPGIKTIIPARAVFKLTARLVAGQDPDHCLRQIVRHLERRTAEGLQVRVVERGVGGPAVRLDMASPLVARARAVLRELDPRPPALRWEGGSIPVVSRLAAVSGARPLLAGFGYEEDNVHAPNESFSLEQFRQGFLFAGLMLNRLSLPPEPSAAGAVEERGGRHGH